MKRSKKKQYAAEFKLKAVQRVLDSSADSHQVSKELGIEQSALNKWVKQFKEGGSSSFNKEDSMAMRKLKAENKRLRAERDILKTAKDFFARHHHDD